MDNYICINGKKAELTEEQIKTLGIELPKTPFDRTKYAGGTYFYISPDGGVLMEFDRHGATSGRYFDAANYCTNKAIMEQRAMWETLSRLLWRFSEQNGGRGMFCIADKGNGNFFAIIGNYMYLEPTFKTVDVANRAIKEIVEPFMKAHPDFVW